MKTTLVFVLFSVLLGSFAWAGNTVANGGDVVAADFAKVARKTIGTYSESTFQREYRPIVRKLKEALVTTRIRSEENLKLDSVEVDAVNIPSENLIIANRSRWNDLRNREKSLLVLHEYLWIAGFDDSNYQLSLEIQEQGTFYPIFFPTPDIL